MDDTGRSIARAWSAVVARGDTGTSVEVAAALTRKGEPVPADLGGRMVVMRSRGEIPS